MLPSVFLGFAIYLQFEFVFSQSIEYQCLEKHNEYREMHSAPPFELDSALTEVAQEWAEHLARTGSFGHRPSNEYGENIYRVFGVQSIDGYAPVKAWYDELKDYDWENPGFSIDTGHFTALVWKGSRKLGCAWAQNGTTYYVVANYSPPGNVEGLFAENVSPS